MRNAFVHAFSPTFDQTIGPSRGLIEDPKPGDEKKEEKKLKEKRAEEKKKKEEEREKAEKKEAEAEAEAKGEETVKPAPRTKSNPD